MNNLSEVIDQMVACGLPQLPSGHPVLDGKIHRFGPKKKSWYAFHEVRLKSGRDVVVGAFGIWQGENNNAVPVKIDWNGITQEERRQAQERQRAFEKREAEKKAQRAMYAANRATVQWREAEGLPVQSDYLARKQVDAENVRCKDGVLLVPALRYVDGRHVLAGLQKVAPDGQKRFNTGMAKQGAYALLGTLAGSPDIILLGEGYATMETVRMATDRKHPAVVAFDCGNLLSVARVLRARFPDTHILFVADDDFRIRQRYIERLAVDYRVQAPPELDGQTRTLITPEKESVVVTAGIRQDVHGDDFITAEVVKNRHGRSLTFRNAGIFHAKSAANDVGNASVVWPLFANRGEQKLTDFNDLHCAESLESVKVQLASAIDAALNGKPNPMLKKSQQAKSAGGKKMKERSSKFWDGVNHLMAHFHLVYGTDEAYDDSKHLLIRIGNIRLAFGNDETKFWLNSPERKMVDKDKVLFDPAGRDPRENTINLFHGWELQPKKGECRKIMELAHHLCGGDVAIMAWLMRWLAYPLKHPGAKMRTSIVVHGDEGSGKNLFFETVVKRIYGEYGGVIGSEQLENQFNEWASKKLFVVADEVITRSELRATKGRLKKLISGDTVFINPKNLAQREEANHMNFVFLSNELQPLVLDPSDRRYLVLWTPKKREKDFYQEVSEEIRNGGIEAFYYHLLNEVTFPDGFNEYADPPRTVAKENLIELGLSPSERFFREWQALALPLPFICCSAQQLYRAFTRWCTLNGERFFPTQTRFGREIERIGSDVLHRQVIKYEFGSEVKQRTCYLVGNKPEEKTQKEWVQDNCEYFESFLDKYRSGGFMPVSEE